MKNISSRYIVQIKMKGNQRTDKNTVVRYIKCITTQFSHARIQKIFLREGVRKIILFEIFIGGGEGLLYRLDIKVKILNWFFFNFPFNELALSIFLSMAVSLYVTVVWCWVSLLEKTYAFKSLFWYNVKGVKLFFAWIFLFKVWYKI